MEFNRETVAAELEQHYGGVKITDGPNGPFELRSSLRMGSQTAKLINGIATEMEAMAERAKLHGEDLDMAKITEMTIDALALRSTSPGDFRTWIGGYPEDDQPAVLRVLQKGLEQADQGESGA